MANIEEMLQTRPTDSLQSEYNVRKSMAWDSAFFTSPGFLNTEELVEALSLQSLDGEMSEFGIPSLSHSGNTYNKAIGGADGSGVRKSFSWDNSFFTSSGVLDAEELSSLIKGTKKPEGHLLPSIEEEICSSECHSSSERDCPSPLDILESTTSKHKLCNGSSKTEATTRTTKNGSKDKNGKHASCTPSGRGASSPRPPLTPSNHANPSRPSAPKKISPSFVEPAKKRTGKQIFPGLHRSTVAPANAKKQVDAKNEFLPRDMLQRTINTLGTVETLKSTTKQANSLNSKSFSISPTSFLKRASKSVTPPPRISSKAPATKVCASTSDSASSCSSDSATENLADVLGDHIPEPRKKQLPKGETRFSMRKLGYAWHKHEEKENKCRSTEPINQTQPVLLKKDSSLKHSRRQSVKQS